MVAGIKVPINHPSNFGLHRQAKLKERTHEDTLSTN